MCVPHCSHSTLNWFLFFFLPSALFWQITGLPSRPREVATLNHNTVRGQPVILHHRRANTRIVLAVRRHPSHRHGTGQIQEDTVRLLLHRILSARRCRKFDAICEWYTFGRSNCARRLGRRIHWGPPIRAGQIGRPGARRISNGFRFGTRWLWEIGGTKDCTQHRGGSMIDFVFNDFLFLLKCERTIGFIFVFLITYGWFLVLKIYQICHFSYWSHIYLQNGTFGKQKINEQSPVNH